MRVGSMILVALLLVGCATKRAITEAEDAMSASQWDRAYRLWEQILEEHPDNTKARIQVARVRLHASLDHLRRGSRYADQNQLQEALFELNLSLGYDPDNQAATNLLDNVTRKIQQAKEPKPEVEKKEDRRSHGFPALEPTTWEPVNLYIPKPKDIRDIYSALGQAYGINILVDSKIRSDKMSIDLRNLDFLKALDTLMVLNRHFFKVIDRNTIIILEDNKTNKEQYTNQVIKTFYLSNITPNDLKNHLRSLGDIKEYAANDELNAITIKGTPQQIALAERIITTNDKPQPEVVIEVELLEVNKTAMRQVGLLPVPTVEGQSGYSVGVVADPLDRDDDQNGLRGFFPSLSSEDFLTIVPAVAINFLKESGDSTQVANPHMRVTAGKEASILIGQRIPVASTSFTPIGVNGTGSSSVSNQLGGQPLTTFNYNDIGIKLNITPRVHHNDEVTLNMDLEVSSVVSQSLQPILGQRKVSTTIRLKNGETNVLFGLLTNEERKSLQGIAGLADIPVIGRLFSNDDSVVTQTDIILTLKPVIVRGHNIQDSDRDSYELSTLSLSSMYGVSRPSEAMMREAIPSQPESEPMGEVISDDADEATPTESEDPALDEDVTELESDTQAAEDDAAQAPAPAVLSFTPVQSSGRQDDLMDIQLFITNARDLKRGELTLKYDPSILQVTAVDVGKFRGSGSRPMMTPAWNHAQGRISLVVFQRGDGPGFSGSGIMAKMRFKALGPGDGVLTLDRVELENSKGEAIPIEQLPAAYEVSP